MMVVRVPQHPREGSRTAKLFMHGRSQAVRLPKEFRLDGAEVRIRRDGDKVILEPLTPSEQALRAAFGDIDRLLGGRDVVSGEEPADPPAAPDTRAFYE